MILRIKWRVRHTVKSGKRYLSQAKDGIVIDECSELGAVILNADEYV